MLNISSKENEIPLKVGITGGIGSGKTTACQIFSVLGIPVFDADRAAKSLYSHEKVRDFLQHLPAAGLYRNDGSIDRKILASLLFSDPVLYQKINGLIHPLVRDTFEKWHNRQTACYVLYEAAILFESGYYRNLDAVILVTAPAETRIQRVMTRDGLSREEIIARMQHQWNDREKKDLADYVLTNDDNSFLTTQVLETDKMIRNYGKDR